jgi:uncharacterized protein DUF3237
MDHLPSSPLETEFLFEIRIPLAAPVDVGAGPDGRRIVLMAQSGRFSGPRLRGEVVPLSGGDWARRRRDGVSVIDARLCLRTEDGAMILMTYQGRLQASPENQDYARDFAKSDDPAGARRYYFRTNPLFETGDERYAWLNAIVAVGSGRTGDGGVVYDVFEVR